MRTRHPRKLPDPPGEHRVREEPDSERGEDRPKPRPRRRHRLLDHLVPGTRARDHGEQVEHDRDDHPSPHDEPEGVRDEPPVGAAPNEERDRGRKEREHCAEPAPPEELHAATALREPETDLVDLGQAAGDPVPRVALLRDHARSASALLPGRLVGEELGDRGRERARLVGRHEQSGVGLHDPSVPGDVGRDHRCRAGERPREHHAEALPAERGRDERFRAQELRRQILLGQEAEHVDAVRRYPQTAEEEPNGERIGPDHPKARSGRPMDLRPGAKEHLQTLARLLAADEDDVPVPRARVRPLGDEDAVRNELVLAREVACRRLARWLGNRDPVVDPVEQEPPDRLRRLEPRQVAGRMVRRHDRTLRESQRRGARGRRHRLVDVDDVEPLLLEDAPDPEDGARAEDDVRKRTVRRHDHRAADGDHSLRRLPVAAEPRVQDAREAARWVVAHHEPDIVAELPESGGLQLGVLDDGSPERPRVGDDDPDLHAAQLCTPRYLLAAS